MSIKHFCDVCGEDINENVVSQRLKHDTLLRTRKGGMVKVMFEITVGTEGTWNSGDLCRDCLFNALGRFDNRPIAAPEVSVVDAMKRNGWSKDEIGAAMDARGAVSA